MTTDETANLIQTFKEDKDFISKAKILKRLNKEEKISIKKLSELTSVKPSYICHILRLNRLPEIVIDGYYGDNISLSHLFIISRLSSEDEIAAAYEKILSDSLTVLQTEEMVREKLHSIKTVGSYLTTNEKDNLIGKITSNQDKIKVKITQTRIKSKLIIEIKGSLDETNKEIKKLLKKIEFWYLD